jgi:hypothetical protein
METPPVPLSNEQDQQPEPSLPSAPSASAGAPQEPMADASSVPPHDDGYEAV